MTRELGAYPTEDRVLEELREGLHRNLAPRRHTALLVAIVALFLVRPLIGDGGIATGAFSSVLLLVLLFALYAQCPRLWPAWRPFSYPTLNFT